MSAMSIFNAVKQKFIAQEAEAVATLDIYVNNAVGVADHSKIIEEVAKQIRLLSEARECLATLENTSSEPDPTPTRKA
tara:strand:+ start:1045 stop:1278 length:234 start_codon:yes stop_codon:yes gene_type:complete